MQRGALCERTAWGAALSRTRAIERNLTLSACAAPQEGVVPTTATINMLRYGEGDEGGKVRARQTAPGRLRALESAPPPCQPPLIRT